MPPKVRKVQVLKRPGNKSPYWYVRYWELQADGKHWKEKWRSTKKTVKKEAELIRRQIERELDAGENSCKDLTWDEFVLEFLEKHASRKAVTTQGAYADCLAIFGRTAKPRQLSAINIGMLEDFANNRLEEVKPATVNKELRHLKAALKWATKREYIDKVPDFGGVFIRVDQEPPTIIPEGDFKTIVASLNKPELKLKMRSRGWWKAFLYLAYYLGLRRGELLGLEWKHVDLAARELRVSARTSKGRKFRVLPIAEELATVLEAWKQEHQSSTKDGQVLPWELDSYRQIYIDWHEILNTAGIPKDEQYVPHDCRSSCASALIGAGVPTVVVKDVLGHQSIATTERYYINTEPALRAAVLRRKVWIDENCSTRRKGRTEKELKNRPKCLPFNKYQRWESNPHAREDTGF
jgi:integrase